MTAPTLSPAEYLSFVEGEYLASYVARGGAAVKLLAVGTEATRQELAGGFGNIGRPGNVGGLGNVSGSDGLGEVGGGFVHATVDAATTKVHLIDQVFTAIARQVDWIALATAVVRAALDRVAFPAPDGPAAGRRDHLDLTAIARHHDVDAAELYRSARRAIEQMVLRDTELSHEFRTAMLRLCQERLGRGDLTATERETVIGWLHGERLPAADLRRVSLHSKVTRYNARPLLLSLTRWLRIAGHAGLVLHLDLGRLAVTRRPPVGLRDGFYYTKAAALDAYEVLRQLIDAMDEFEGLFVAVQLPSSLVHDETRGLPAYTALQLRVVDEVRDRHRANPYAALVRIGPQLEVTT